MCAATFELHHALWNVMNDEDARTMEPVRGGVHLTNVGINNINSSFVAEGL